MSTLDSAEFFAKIACPVGASFLAYLLWHYVSARHDNQRAQDRLLVGIYIASRVGLWLIFALFLQQYVTISDPKWTYTKMLEHLLVGRLPLRDFFYHYGPLLIPTMLPFYLLVGRTLAGISLFAIFVEAVALLFLLKSIRLLSDRGEAADTWLRESLAVYLLNPATLYWTILHGYNSIVPTTYLMVAAYLLLCGRIMMGYVVGLYSPAGSSILALLNWPALLVIRRPRLTTLAYASLPLLTTYVFFQMVTHKNVLFPFTFVTISEGNLWYLLKLFGIKRPFQSLLPGNLLPLSILSSFLLVGVVYQRRQLKLGLTDFSLKAAMGVCTFLMSLFFIFSLNSGSYYVPMLMLPASLVVASKASSRRIAVSALLTISAFCVAGDAIWSTLGQPEELARTIVSDSGGHRFLMGLSILSVVVRIVCFAMLARWAFMKWTRPCAERL